MTTALTIAQLAARWGVSREMIRGAIRRGEIRATLGPLRKKPLRVPLEEIERIEALKKKLDI